VADLTTDGVASREYARGVLKGGSRNQCTKACFGTISKHATYTIRRSVWNTARTGGRETAPYGCSVGDPTTWSHANLNSKKNQRAAGAKKKLTVEKGLKRFFQRG